MRYFLCHFTYYKLIFKKRIKINIHRIKIVVLTLTSTLFTRRKWLHLRKSFIQFALFLLGIIHPEFQSKTNRGNLPLHTHIATKLLVVSVMIFSCLMCTRCTPHPRATGYENRKRHFITSQCTNAYPLTSCKKHGIRRKVHAIIGHSPDDKSNEVSRHYFLFQRLTLAEKCARTDHRLPWRDQIRDWRG